MLSYLWEVVHEFLLLVMYVTLWWSVICSMAVLELACRVKNSSFFSDEEGM
jgi:hypothetical protein